MANVLVDGAIVRVTPVALATWSFGIGTAPVGYLDVVVTGTGAKITKSGKKVCTITDITTALSGITGQAYHDTSPPGFGTQAGGMDGALGYVSNTPAVGATKMTDSSIRVAIDSDSGTGVLSATPPIGVLATNPGGGTPIPDPVPLKSYDWVVQDHGQGTVKLTAI